jgi:hypothetical protein
MERPKETYNVPAILRVLGLEGADESHVGCLTVSWMFKKCRAG